MKLQLPPPPKKWFFFFSIFNRSSTTHRNSLCIGILYCAKLAKKLLISNVNLGPNNLNKVYLSLIDTCCIFNYIWNSRPHACCIGVIQGFDIRFKSRMNFKITILNPYRTNFRISDEHTRRRRFKCMPFSNITLFKFYTSIIIHYTQYTTMHLSQARIQEFSSGVCSISENIWQAKNPKKKTYQSNLFTRPHLWQISGGRGSGTPPPPPSGSALVSHGMYSPWVK